MRTKRTTRRRAPVFNQLPITKARVRYIVGIDPDIKKSGLAIYDCEQKVWTDFGDYTCLHVETYVRTLPAENTTVYVEAGWLNQGLQKKFRDNPPKDWHLWPNDQKLAWMFARGVDVGENFRAGKFFVERLREYGFEVVEYRPVTAKWDAQDLARYTGITKRTNPEIRDAIKIVFFNI